MADAHQAIQKAIEGAVGALTDEFIEAVATEDDAPEALMLAGWVMVSHWINPHDPDENWYHVSHTPAMAPHVAAGLLRQGLWRE